MATIGPAHFRRVKRVKRSFSVFRLEFPQEDSELDRRRALYGSARMLPLDAGHFDLGMSPKKKDHHQNNETIDANKKTHTKTKNNTLILLMVLLARIECLTGITCAWDLTHQIRRRLDVWAAHAREKMVLPRPCEAADPE